MTLIRVSLRTLMLVAFSIFMVSFSLPTAAHEIRPTIADFTSHESGEFTLSISLNLEALIAEIGPEHNDSDDSPNAARYDALRAHTPDALKKEFTDFSEKLFSAKVLRFGDVYPKLTVEKLEVPEIGDVALPRLSKVVVTGAIPDGQRTFIWTWPEEYGQSVIRVEETPDAADPSVGYSAFLLAGEASDEIPIKGAVRGFFEVVADYVHIGFTHILPKGLDHILFVVGLFLLSAKLSTLLWQVTSFTLAHTVTLALGIFGVIQISPSIVEPLIAASIVYVCVENILTERLQRWRPVIIFCFGLLHGLGFAGVLQEIGLVEGHFITGLIAFNVGVELGQLAVIAICFLLVGFWFQNKPWYRKVITIPASVVIALIGTWWFYERVFLA